MNEELKLKLAKILVISLLSGILVEGGALALAPFTDRPGIDKLAFPLGLPVGATGGGLLGIIWSDLVERCIKSEFKKEDQSIISIVSLPALLFGFNALAALMIGQKDLIGDTMLSQSAAVGVGVLLYAFFACCQWGCNTEEKARSIDRVSLCGKDPITISSVTPQTIWEQASEKPQAEQPQTELLAVRLEQ